MSLFRRLLFASPAALVMLAATSPRVGALPPGERTLFIWSGQIDREATIVIRGRQVETRASGLDASFAPRLEVRDDLPRSAGRIEVHMADGRGNVNVLQQPNAGNDFTAVVNVRDSRGGRDLYRLVVLWRPVIDVPTRYDPRDRDRDRDNDRNRDRGRDRDDDRSRNGDWDRGGNNRRRGNTASWTGNVDDVVEIRIQGRRVEYRTRSGQPLLGANFAIRGSGIPKAPVTVDVDIARGRGNVDVIQQPDRWNRYTTIIRVVDRRAGYGNYDFDIYWH